MHVIVVIPGIMATRLHLPAPGRGPGEQAAGEQVWPPSPLETKLGYGRIDELLRPDLVVGEMIDAVLCFKFYATLTAQLQALGFTESGADKRRVAFAYDWRRDNFDTAALLADRLDALHAAGARRFSLVAHSMGGLIARLLLESRLYDSRPWFGGVELLATLGTPHLGAPLALARIFGIDATLGIDGADFARLAADSRYPSGYQLIPAPGEQAVWDLASPDLAPLDVYDPATARMLGMDPALVARAAALHAALAAGRRPDHVRYFYVGGTGHATATRVNVFRDDGRVNHADSVVTRTPDGGDGTVPLWSALPVSGQRQIVVNAHATVFEGAPFRRVLFRLLGGDAGPVVEALDSAAGKALALSVETPVGLTGAPVGLVLAVEDAAGEDGAGDVTRIDGRIVIEEIDASERPLGVARDVALRYEGPALSRLAVDLAPFAAPGLFRARFEGAPPGLRAAPFAIAGGPAQGAAGGLLRRLGRTGAAGLESDGAAPDLGDARRATSLGLLRERLARGVAASPDPRAADLAAALTEGAQAGLSRLAAEGPQARLTRAMTIGLEAVILADGSRPALFVQDDRIDVSDPELGDWAGFVGGRRLLALGRVARATGRVEDPAADQGFAGTAFAVAEGVVATNRHVLEAIAAPDGAGWRLNPGVAVNFAAEHERPADPARRFAVARVLYAGPDPIGGGIDLRRLDLALLELAPGAGPFPAALPRATDAAGPAAGARLYVMGVPGRPRPGAEAQSTLERIFAHTWGVKRFAPGEVEKSVGALAGDADPAWCFSHDASTLGGMSGSCVVDLADGETVVGLHFGGQRRVENYAHAVARLADRFSL